MKKTMFKKVFNENVIFHNIIGGFVIYLFYLLAMSAQNSPNQWAQEQAIVWWITMGAFIVLDVFFNYVMIFDN